MRYRYHTVDVFTSKPFGGNPLVVFPDARGLDDGLMQQIAREMNVSETAFVFPPDDASHTRRLRLFTPSTELPFAGHPTLGAAFVLAHAGELPLQGDETNLVFEEGIGPVPVVLKASDGEADFAWLTSARLPETGHDPPPGRELATMLGLRTDDILTGAHAPEVLSCGVPFLFVPLASRDALRWASLRLDLWEHLQIEMIARGVYLLCFQPELPGSNVRGRMLAPNMGIREDPATGAAVSALAGYLAARHPGASGRMEWVVEQGFEMQRPSLLYVRAELNEGQITAVHVGGAAVMVSEGTMEVPVPG